MRLKCLSSQRLFCLGVILFVATMFVQVAVAQHSYTEDFTNTTYKDVKNTTALWDTMMGELKLYFLFTLEGSYDTPGSAHSITISGNYAFVADANSGPGIFGLKVIDISDPANPTLVGSYDTPSSARDVAISGNYAFVVNYESGLQVIDISDPANPTLAGSYDTPSIAMGVTISGNYAFVADYGSGLQVIDISDPTNPAFAGSYDTPGHASSVTISGNYAFVVDHSFGLQVIDISDPTNPAFAGNCDTADDAHDAAISGNYAFVANGNYGLQVIDISDPANPALAGNYDTSDCATAVAISGNYAYVASNNSARFQVFDITDPSNPRLVGSYSALNYPYDVAISGNHAFLASGHNGLQVIRISNPVVPALVGTCDTPDWAARTTVSGNYAFVADSASGLQVLDISDPAMPAVVGSYDTPGHLANVTVAGDRAYLADGPGGLIVLDITIPETPAFLSQTPITGVTMDLVVAGDVVYIAAEDAGLVTLDISDPSNPLIIGNYDSPGSARDIYVDGDFCFLADNDAGLQILDISDPSAPGLIGSYDTPGFAYAVSVSRNTALVADEGAGLQVIDISDPSMPFHMATLPLPGKAVDVAVSGDLAFVAGSMAGIHVVDITDISAPVLIGSLGTADQAWGVSIDGGVLYVSSGFAGLGAVQVMQPFDTSRNVAQSLSVFKSSDEILRVSLNSTQSDGVGWDISADGGLNWQSCLPDGEWAIVKGPGSDLMWHATLCLDQFGNSPRIDHLQIDWLTEDPNIVDVTDIPNDQGSWVQAHFSRSAFDFMDVLLLPITNYGIWRRIDNLVLSHAVSEEFHGNLVKRTDPTIVMEGVEITSYDDRTFVSAESSSNKPNFPEGTWELVMEVPAVQHDTYIVSVPTIADSSSVGLNCSVFVVTAHTTAPSEWYISEPDSGYSVDNIAPGIPEAVTAAYEAGGVALDWDDAPESDFQNYRVYRDTDSGFVPSPTSLVHEVAVSAWTDATANPWDYHYKITTLDYTGNESEAGSPETMSGTEDQVVPQRTALLGAVPNPFNPSTKLFFEMAVPGHARLKVFDAGGRLVATLLDEHRDAGTHDVTWDGRDTAGRTAAAGVYLYRLEAEGYVGTRRVVLIK